MSDRTILVVDDERKIRQLVRAYLEKDGYTVIEAAGGREALDKARSHNPDLIVLDVMLPGLDGIEVLRELRTFSNVYVVMLTAKTEEVDKLIGLSVGADDYLSKPFSPRELLARIKAVLRRDRGLPKPEANAFRFDGLTLDGDRREVTRSGAPVELTALEFDLLAALVSEPGRVFSRRQLLERVWGWDFFGDERVVDVHVRNLRKALGDDATQPTIIGTVRGVGYKFLLES
ncbi:MAG: response regulator transcription factor [Acidimicrobiia bacterium]|nr:response regulator transcription factor [Acidimicrobiia bacterium]